eukprot:SAG11_NODE_143_length_14870_cov_6.472412_2_plen_2365_part_00
MMENPAHLEAELRIRARSQALLQRMNSHQTKIKAHVNAAEKLSEAVKTANSVAAGHEVEVHRLRDLFSSANVQRNARILSRDLLLGWRDVVVRKKHLRRMSHRLWKQVCGSVLAMSFHSWKEIALRKKHAAQLKNAEMSLQQSLQNAVSDAARSHELARATLSREYQAQIEEHRASSVAEVERVRRQYEAAQSELEHVKQAHAAIVVTHSHELTEAHAGLQKEREEILMLKEAKHRDAQLSMEPKPAEASFELSELSSAHRDLQTAHREALTQLKSLTVEHENLRIAHAAGQARAAEMGKFRGHHEIAVGELKAARAVHAREIAEMERVHGDQRNLHEEVVAQLKFENEQLVADHRSTKLQLQEKERMQDGALAQLETAAAKHAREISHLCSENQHLRKGHAGLPAQEEMTPTIKTEASDAENLADVQQLGAIHVSLAESGPLGIVFKTTMTGAASVSKINPTSQASKHPQLVHGLILKAINGESVEGKEFQMVISMVNASARPVTLGFDTATVRDKSEIAESELMDARTAAQQPSAQPQSLDLTPASMERRNRKPQGRRMSIVQAMSQVSDMVSTPPSPKKVKPQQEVERRVEQCIEDVVLARSMVDSELQRVLEAGESPSAGTTAMAQLNALQEQLSHLEADFRASLQDLESESRRASFENQLQKAVARVERGSIAAVDTEVREQAALHAAQLMDELGGQNNVKDENVDATGASEKISEFHMLSVEEQRDRVEFFRNLQLLRPLPNSELEELAQVTMLVTFREGDAIVMQGAQATCMYFLYTGTASAKQGGHVLMSYESGDYFGELALMNTASNQRAASVYATSAVSCLSLARESFQKLIVTYDHAGEIFGTMAKQYAAGRIQAAYRGRMARHSVFDATMEPQSPRNSPRAPTGSVPVASFEADDKLEFFKGVKMFDTLCQPCQQLFADSTSAATYEAGDNIILQGEVGQEMFFLSNGNAVAKIDGQVVMVYTAGSYFGELALLDSCCRGATITAVDMSTCLRLERSAFDLIHEECANACKQFLKEAAASSMYVQHSDRGSRHRLIRNALRKPDDQDDGDDSDGKGADENDAVVQRMMLEALGVSVDDSGAQQDAAADLNAENLEDLQAMEVGEIDHQIELELRKGFLRAVPLFSDLTDLEIEQTAEVVASETYEDESIIEQGDDGRDLFIVRQGTANAIKDEATVIVYSSGDYFGEVALLRNSRRTATVMAQGKVECLRLGRDRFQQLVKTCSHIRSMLTKQQKNYAASKIQAAYRGHVARLNLFDDLDFGGDSENGGAEFADASVGHEESSDLSFLASIKAFSTIPRVELEQILSIMASEVYENEPIIEEGEEGRDLFIVRRGTAVVQKNGTTTVAYVPGQYFGELALLRESRRAATVMAQGEVECLRLGSEPFRQYMHMAADVGAAFRDSLTSYSKSASTESQNSATGDEPAHLGAIQVSLAEPGPLGIVFKSMPNSGSIFISRINPNKGQARNYPQLVAGLVLKSLEGESINGEVFKDVMSVITAGKRPLTLGFDAPIELERKEEAAVVSPRRGDAWTVQATLSEPGSLGIVFKKVGDHTVISRINPTGQASKHPQLVDGLMLKAINSEPVDGREFHSVIDMIKASQRPVTLGLNEPINVISESPKAEKMKRRRMSISDLKDSVVDSFSSSKPVVPIATRNQDAVKKAVEKSIEDIVLVRSLLDGAGADKSRALQTQLLHFEADFKLLLQDVEDEMLRATLDQQLREALARVKRDANGTVDREQAALEAARLMDDLEKGEAAPHQKEDEGAGHSDRSLYPVAEVADVHEASPRAADTTGNDTADIPPSSTIGDTTDALGEELRAWLTKHSILSQFSEISWDRIKTALTIAGCSTPTLMRAELNALKQEGGLDGLSRDLCDNRWQRISLRKSTEGFGMVISASGVVSEFHGAGGVAETAGVVVGSRIVAVNGQLVTTKRNVLCVLKEDAESTNAVFTFDQQLEPSSSKVAMIEAFTSERPLDRSFKGGEYRIIAGVHASATPSLLSSMVAKLDAGEVVELTQFVVLRGRGGGLRARCNVGWVTVAEDTVSPLADEIDQAEQQAIDQAAPPSIVRQSPEGSPKKAIVEKRRMSVAVDGVSHVAELGAEMARSMGMVEEKVFEARQLRPKQKNVQIKVGGMGVTLFDGPKLLESAMYRALTYSCQGEMVFFNVIKEGKGKRKKTITYQMQSQESGHIVQLIEQHRHKAGLGTARASSSVGSAGGSKRRMSISARLSTSFDSRAREPARQAAAVPQDPHEAERKVRKCIEDVVLASSMCEPQSSAEEQKKMIRHMEEGFLQALAQVVDEGRRAELDEELRQAVARAKRDLTGDGAQIRSQAAADAARMMDEMYASEPKPPTV